jgi:NAD(P)-dependent dehydrogenase (short-subunit alcohol dehydrogenase family)
MDMYNPMDLTGKRILVTGASSGIGQACAVMASRLGAQCVLVARSEKGLAETYTRLEGDGHAKLPFDLMNLDKIENLFIDSVKEGKLSGVVHAAGVCPAAPIGYQTIDEMRSAMTLNFFSFLEMMKFVAKKKFFVTGSVVVLSSISASVGWRGGVLYSGTKGALSASVRSLALELVERGVRVNAVQPSNIRTPMFDAVAGDINTEEGLSELRRKQPLGIGEPEDVASAVCFLLSDAARFITGTNMVVDGGYLAQ